MLDPKANLRALLRIVVLLSVLVGGAWLFLRFTVGEKAADRATSTFVRSPIVLQDTIESLPANSFKGLPIQPPYAGEVTIEIVVRKGNDVDVFLVPEDQMPALKSKSQFRYVRGFEAEKTRSYKRSVRIAAGTYYVVLFDRTLGILSQSSSDIQLRAILAP